MSAKNNREREVKLIVQSGETYSQVKRSLLKTYHEKCVSIISGDSKDVYFDTKSLPADFARVRYGRKGDSSWLTAKYTDKNGIGDRVEIDVVVKDPKQAEIFCKQLFGEPAGVVQKKYDVFFLNKYSDNISIYQIKDDPRVFVEIEARTTKHVETILKAFLKNFPFLEVKRSPSSLYQLFVQKPHVA